VYDLEITFFFLEKWSLITAKKQIVGGSEHTLRAKLTFAQESHGIYAYS